MGRWFHPRKETGWRKDQEEETRRRHLMDSTDHRRDLHDRRVEAGRRVQALANVTKDRETKRVAEADAEYFFRRARGR